METELFSSALCFLHCYEHKKFHCQLKQLDLASLNQEELISIRSFSRWLWDPYVQHSDDCEHSVELLELTHLGGVHCENQSVYVWLFALAFSQ